LLRSEFYFDTQQQHQQQQQLADTIQAEESVICRDFATDVEIWYWRKFSKK
jgi:hypothetical protein